MLEASWHDDVAIIMSPLLGAVAALNEELVRSVFGEAGFEGSVVWSTRRGVWCTQGACFLGCMRLQVKANNSLKCDGWFVRYAGLDPSFGLGLVRHGAR